MAQARAWTSASHTAMDLILTIQRLERTPPPTPQLKAPTPFQQNARLWSLIRKARRSQSTVRILTEFSKDPARRLWIRELQHSMTVLVQNLYQAQCPDRAE